MRARWDGDERGRGVTSAASEISALDRLRRAMDETDWVAEDPDIHLLPSLEAACAERGWALDRADVVDGVLHVEVVAPAGSRRELRAAAFTLLGAFAELSTHVVEEPTEAREELSVVATTGILESDSGFAPHGHVVRLRIVAA